MTAIETTLPAPAPTATRLRAERPTMMVVGASLLGLVAAAAVLAPVLADHDPTTVSGLALEQPSPAHWFGTDVPGRDLFAQLVYGARSSLTVALLAGSLTMVGAIIVGVLPGLVGGLTDTLTARAVVFLLALPGLPLLILIGTLAGDSRLAVIVLIAFVGVAPNARILRSQTVSLRQRGFITAARGFGGGRLYVLRRHLLPAVAPLLVTGFIYVAEIAILIEAGLAFLGLGDPIAVSWGADLNRALTNRQILIDLLWLRWLMPVGLALTLAIVGFTLIGVALEPRFNARTSRAR